MPVQLAPVRPGLVERYREEDAAPIVVDRAAIEALGVEAVTRPLASETHNYARHSFARLAEAVMELYNERADTKILRKGGGTMSFSSEVKAELCRTALSRRCCARRRPTECCSTATSSPPHRCASAPSPTPLPPGCPPCSTGRFQLSFDRTPEEGGGQADFLHHRAGQAVRPLVGVRPWPAGTLAHHINFAVLEEEHCRLAFFSGGLSVGRLGDRPGQALPPGAVHPPI